MESESLDMIVLTLAYTELLGYTAKGLLYYFSKSKNSGIDLTEENTRELITPMIYNFSRLIYRDLTSRVTEKGLDGLREFDKQVL